MNNELPDFRKTKYAFAMTYITQVLSGTSLVHLIEYDDHHFRAIFRSSYFQFADGSDEPSKSQWGTLKKKMKRRNRSIFVFREYGKIACEDRQKDSDALDDCLFIDFGYLYM